MLPTALPPNVAMIDKCAVLFPWESLRARCFGASRFSYSPRVRGFRSVRLASHASAACAKRLSRGKDPKIDDGGLGGLDAELQRRHEFLHQQDET